MGRVRVHQHVNPLAPYFRFTPNPIEFEKIFADPLLPLFLDIGCARGRFLLQMAELEKSQNYLGVEIREALVIEGNRLAQEANLGNLHFEFCNAMFELNRLLQHLSPGLLHTVTIQFSDPWFKKKHSKRRMVTPELVKTVTNLLAPDGLVFVQTDIEFLGDEMFELFRESGMSETILPKNPFSVKTEREIAVEAKEMPVYRRIYRH